MRYLTIILFILLTAGTSSAVLPNPPVIKDVPTQQYLQELYKNHNNLQVITTAPNGNRVGKKGDLVIYNTFLWSNTDGGTTWINLSLATGSTDHALLSNLDYASAAHTGFQPEGTGVFTVYNVKTYGATGDGITDDTVAIQAAIDAIDVTGIGGIVFFPSGNYLISTGITIPEYVGVEGSGHRSTVLTYSGTGTAITLGSSTASSLVYGTFIRKIAIILTNIAGKAILLGGTCGASLEDIYLEGVVTATRTNIGVVIDGADISSFFNTLKHIQCNHMQTGFKMKTSGSVKPTTSVFINCQSFGDVTSYPANGSIGFDFDLGCGGGSIIIGGNVEDNTIGVNLPQGNPPKSFHGLRFESNTTDIVFGLYSTGCDFVGCKNIDNVTDNSGTGYGRHSFLGCTKSDDTVYTNTLTGGMDFASSGVSNIPLIVTGYPTQTGNLLNIRNSSNTVLFSVNATGDRMEMAQGNASIVVGTGSPEGVVTASTSSLYFNLSGGSLTSLYVKETGTGNTGWVGK